MSRTHYKIYQEQTFVLAKTLIIKHEEVARSMNEELYNRQYVIDTNPYNWRYYLNLSGEYHEADRDELYAQYGTEFMLVKLPSDSGPVEVELTKELLHGVNADKALTNEYQIGSKFYTELVSRYPDFETLIIGILNPIEREVSLSAKNGEILFVAGRYKKINGSRRWFDTEWYSINEVLIEPQEDNLIFELQKYIYNFLRHWNNPDYVVGNDLYVVTMLGILYSNIVVAILNIRLGNCKTVKAHTFHIREYLESHGQIGRYVDFIPIASSLWLYRNTMYLEANAGKQLTFDSIMDNILTPNEIPMSAYSIRHELSNMGDDKLTPTGMLYKEILNFEVVGASDDDRTVRDILDDQIDLARDNHLDLDEKTVKIQDVIDWGGDDRINSKVLESEMLELGEPYPFTQAQFLFNMWGYTALRGYYTGTAYATNPLNGERISFSAKNAYILAQYCMNKAVAGITLDRIPTPTIYNIPKTNQPEHLPNSPAYSVKPSIDKCMSWCVTDHTRRLKVLEVNGTFIPEFYAIDSESFFNNVNDIYHERIRKYNVYCDIEEIEERGDLELVAKRLYWMGFKQPSVDMLYDDWFRTVGFDPDNFSDNDLLNIGLELIASATGTADQETISKRWLQKSLLAIMRQFISYSVHIIEKFADGVVSYLEGQTLRYSNFKWNYIGGLPVKYSISHDYLLKSYITQKVHLDVSNLFEKTVVDVQSEVRAMYDISAFSHKQKTHRLNVGVYALNTEVFNVEFNTETPEPVYLVIIDDSINTITLNPVAARILDTNVVFTIVSTKMNIDIRGIYANSADTLLSLLGLDSTPSGITVDGVFADITDDNNDNNILPDQGVVQPTGVQGAISDAIIESIIVIDDSTIDINNLHANARNLVDNSRFDLESLNLTNIYATQFDNELLITHVDNSQLNLVDMEVSLVDPQVPGVLGPSDNVAGSITNIHGSSQDVVIAQYGMGSSALILDNILVKVSEDFVIIDSSLDKDSMLTGAIAMSSKDIGNYPRTIELIDTVVTGNISAMYADNIIESTVNDTTAIQLINITGDINDTSSSVASDTYNISTSAITANINDYSTNTTACDIQVLRIQNISMVRQDAVTSGEVVDIDVTLVDNISMSLTDVNNKVKTTPESDIISITQVDINVNEQTISTNDPDALAVSITNISSDMTPQITDVNHESSDSVIIPTNLITVSLNDIDVDINFRDNNSLTATQLHGNAITSKVALNYNNERNYLEVNSGSVGIIIDDNLDTFELNDSDQLTAVSVGSVHGNITNNENITKPTDNNALMVSSISMSMYDHTLNIQVLDNSETVPVIQPTAVNISDADYTQTSNDIDSVNISDNISITIIDESE